MLSHTILSMNHEMLFILDKGQGPAPQLLLPCRAGRYKGPLCRAPSQTELLQ